MSTRPDLLFHRFTGSCRNPFGCFRLFLGCTVRYDLAILIFVWTASGLSFVTSKFSIELCNVLNFLVLLFRLYSPTKWCVIALGCDLLNCLSHCIIVKNIEYRKHRDGLRTEHHSIGWTTKVVTIFLMRIATCLALINPLAQEARMKKYQNTVLRGLVLNTLIVVALTLHLLHRIKIRYMGSLKWSSKL